LENALSDENVNAIEADILLGSSFDASTKHFEESNALSARDILSDGVPIMAHPPNRTSQLSLHSFLSRALRPPFKHIKLDMKELQVVPATLSCLLNQINNCQQESRASLHTTVFLNADIFPGQAAATL
jgi:hypothetical protein